MTIGDLEAFCACWNRHGIDGPMSFMTDDCVFMSSAGPDNCGTRRSSVTATANGSIPPTAHRGVVANDAIRMSVMEIRHNGLE